MFSFIKNLFKRKKAMPPKKEWERRIENPSPVNRVIAGSGARTHNVTNFHAADSYMPIQYDPLYPLAITLANAAIETSSSYESSSCSDSSSYDSGSSDSSSSCSF